MRLDSSRRIELAPTNHRSTPPRWVGASRDGIVQHRAAGTRRATFNLRIVLVLLLLLLFRTRPQPNP
jgi:hypothetical protein